MRRTWWLATSRLRKDARGAIDLASIMVGILVLAIIGGVIAASVFVVIPWAQDSAARSALSSVDTAQSVALVKDGSYAEYAALKTRNYLQSSDSIDVITDALGSCYVAASASATGITYFRTSRSPAILNDAAGTPDTGWCTSAYRALSSPVQNLSRGPSFEVVSGAVVHRTNFAPNPAAAAGGTSWGVRWFGRDGAGTHTYISSGGPTGDGGPASFVRKAWSTSPTDNGDTGLAAVVNAPVTSDKTMTASGWLRASADGKTASRARIYWRDAGDVVISITNSVSEQLEPGVWTRVSVSGARPTGAVTGTVILDVGAGTVWLPGDTLDATGAVFEIAGYRAPYFDGSRTPSSDFSASWTGAANSGESQLTARRPVNKPTNFSGVSTGKMWMSSTGAQTGASSVALTKDGGYSYLGCGTLNVKPNTVYTYSVIVSSPTGTTINLVDRGFGPGSGLFNPAPRAVSPTPTVISRSFTTDSTPTRCIDVGVEAAGAVDGTTYYIDDEMITEGATVTAYGDGSTPGWAWDGAAGASPSSGYARR